MPGSGRSSGSASRRAQRASTTDTASAPEQTAAGAASTSSPSTQSASKSTSLYDVLGVAPSASHGDIKKAYYKLALLLHPDKNREDSPDTAKKKFQVLQESYAVLSDPERRSRYDQWGITSPEGGDESFFFNEALFAQFAHLIRPAQFDATDIDKYLAQYYNSAEERGDLLRLLKAGRVLSLFEDIIGSEPSDVKRYLRILQELSSCEGAADRAQEHVPAEFRLTKDAEKKLVAKAKRMAKLNAREAKEVAQERAKAGKKSDASQSLGALIAARQANRQVGAGINPNGALARAMQEADSLSVPGAGQKKRGTKKDVALGDPLEPGSAKRAKKS